MQPHVAQRRLTPWRTIRSRASRLSSQDKTAAALSGFSKTGLTDIEDIVPYIRFMVSDGWWMTGQTILVNGGYTTK